MPCLQNELISMNHKTNLVVPAITMKNNAVNGTKALNVADIVMR